MTKIPLLGMRAHRGVIVDVIRRLPGWRGPNTVPFLTPRSPLALAGGMVYIKLAPILIQQLSQDDYHFGEYLLPGWSIGTFGAIPFWDYVPARGLINYADGAIAALTFGHTAAGIASSISLVAALTLILGLISVSLPIGLLPAAAAFLMVPLEIQPTQVDILNTCALVGILYWEGRVRPVSWLVAWTGIGTLAILIAPAQGTILVLATMPLGAWQAVRAFRTERIRLLRVGGASAAIAIVLLLATPLGRMIVGALRYARDHSTVSGPAHGLEWALSAGSFPSLNRWLFEAVRTSWMVVQLPRSLLPRPGPAGRGAAQRATRGGRSDRDHVGVLRRAAGRIDPAWVAHSAWQASGCSAAAALLHMP